MRFALVSTVANVGQVLLAHLAAVAAPELARVAAAWAVVDPSIVAPSVVVRAGVSALIDGDTPIVFVPALDQPLDLAYHTIAGTQPYALVLSTQSEDEITQGAFHEMAETVVDAMTNGYIGGTALEVCDPVQTDPLTRDGVLLSAWVTPAWFGIGDGACAVSDEGFELSPGALRPGGYKMHEDGTQEPPGYRRKTHPSSRAARREAARVARCSA